MNKSIVRLGFTPSPNFADAIRAFYNEDNQPSDDEIKINSLGAAVFPVTLYGQSNLIRPFPSIIESHDEPTINARIKDFEANHLRKIFGQKILLASIYHFEKSKPDAWHLRFRVLPSEEQKQELDNFYKIYDSRRIDLRDRGIYVETGIPTLKHIANTALKSAKMNLGELLGLNMGGMPSEYARMNTEVNTKGVYVTPNSTLSIDSIPRLVSDDDANTNRIA